MSGFKFLHILRSPSEELLKILKDNVIGTPGLGMLYQHRGVENKIYKIAAPHFVLLGRGTTIFGTGCLCKRQTSNLEEPKTAFYIRYFTFKAAFRRKKLNARNAAANSDLRKEVSALLEGKDLDLKSNEAFYHYAYVDPRNLRSLVLCNEFGFEKVREYTTIIFSRLNPKRGTVEEVAEANKEEIVSLLKEFYQGHTMYSTENIFNGRPYFVIRDQEGKILAGASVNPDQWNVIDLPGKSGKFTLKLFSNLPILNRILNQDYRFLTLEGLYLAAGAEASLAQLMEALLHQFQRYSAITLVDADSKLYTSLKSLDLGSVSKLSKEVRGNVIVKCQNCSPEFKETLTRYPAYISGIDVT